MIAFVLKPSVGFKALQLVRIQVPLTHAADEIAGQKASSATIFTTSKWSQSIRTAIENLQTLNTPEHPFVAWPTSHAALQLVCTKVAVVRLFKALLREQRALGVTITDLKSHVDLTPLPEEELRMAWAQDVHLSLKSAGWWPLQACEEPAGPSRPCAVFLGEDPFADADGSVRTTAVIDLQVEIRSPDSVILLLKPSTARFRHSTVSAFADHAADLKHASREVAGNLCKVLPSETPGMVDRMRLASAEEAGVLQREWAAAGWTLPPGSTVQAVDVRFEEDLDAPTTPFPACAVLSSLGLDSADTRLQSAGVLGALRRLQSDLAAAVFLLQGSGAVGLKEVRKWDENAAGRGLSNSNGKKMQAKHAPVLFQTANKVAPAAVARTPLVLGPHVDLDALQAGSDAAEGKAVGARQKKPHAHAGPELRAFLLKLEREAAKEEAAPKQAVALPPSMAVHRSIADGPPKRAASTSVPVGAANPAALAFKLASKRPAGAAAPGPAAKKPAAKAKGAAAVGGAAGAGAAKSAKAPKAPAAEIEVAALAVPGLVAGGRLSTLTIPQLKAFCRSVKLAVGGKKGDLEERIKAHFQKEQ